MKKISSYFGILAFLILALVTFSCEIGLGAAIDIVPPKAEISSPKDSAIIRGDFSLFGTWTDDGELGKVEVVLQSTSNSSLHYNFKGEFTGNLPNEEKTWKCLINPVSSTNPVKDGEYTATISFFDKAGRESKVTKTFTIDNTPPVIVLQRPGTKRDPANSANADSYGQIFSLEGQGADSNNIDHIDIRIYDDSACLNHLRTVTLNNVPLNIKLDVATFGGDVYTAIYGSTGKNGEKKLYCEIDSYDGAQKYPTEIGKKQTAEDLIGNKTSTYYLYDDLQNILSKYNIARLYEMMNGTYRPSEDGSSSGESSEQIIAKVKLALSGKEARFGMFSLNPENNPRFTVNGKDPLRAESLNIRDESQGYYITNETDITVEVSPGLDGTQLINTTESPLKVYAIECDVQGHDLPGAKRIYPHVARPSQKAGSTYKLFVNLAQATSASEDGTTHLELRKMYKFGVEGEDAKGNEIIPSLSTGYGFFLESAGLAPQVTVINKTDYIKNGQKVELDVKIDGEAPFAIVVLQDNGTPNWQETPGTTSSSSGTVSIEVTPISSPASRQIKVRVTDNSARVTTKSVNYSVDNSAPDDPIIESPSTGATGNNSLSGAMFVFSGKANDAATSIAGEISSGIKKLYYAFMTSDTSPTDSQWTTQSASNGTWNINATLQTGTGTNTSTTLYEGKYWLYVKSEDGAGNQSAEVKREFFVDQSAPSIADIKLKTSVTPPDVFEPLAEVTVKFFKIPSGNFSITGKVTDSNGTDSVLVNGNDVGAIASDGSWSYSITRAENSKIDFSIVATDKAGRTTTKNYSIYCDTNNPVLSITNPDADLTGENSLAVDNYAFGGSVNDSGSGVDSFKYMISQTDLAGDSAIIASAEAGTDWQTQSGSSFSVTKDLIEGTAPQSGKIHEGKWYLYLYAKDKLGNSAAKKRTFWVDKKSPTLSLDNIASVTNQAVVVKGSASDANGIENVKVKFNPKPADWASDTETLTPTQYSSGKTYTLGNSGNNLPDGRYTILVTATDKAGKIASHTKEVCVDTAAPDGTVAVSDTANFTESGKNWYKKNYIKIKFTPSSDSGSEIEDVKAKLRSYGDTNTSGTEDLVKTTSSGVTWWEASLPAPEQGRNEIYLSIKDKAGNTAEKKSPATADVYIDTESPDDCTVYNYVSDSTNYSSETPLIGSKTINGKIAREFVIKALDKNNSQNGKFSGIGKIYYKYNNTPTDYIYAQQLGTSDYYKITIPANNGTTFYQKTGTVKFYIEDKVGNRLEFSAFSFVIDNTPPSVQINPVTDALKASDGDTTSNIDVNGVVDISGTSNEIATITLKYFVGTAEPSDWTASTVKSATVSGTTSWTASINTAAESDNKNLYIKAFAKDEAGNVGESGTMTLYINQDSDRPTITFSNLDLSESTVWLKGIKTVYGSVLDDDGAITSIEYKNGASGTYSLITINNGSWEQEMQDGQNDIYFKIVDKTGKIFETGTTLQPKLKSVKAGVSIFKTGVLTIKVDTTSPSYTNLEFASKKNDGTTSAFASDINSLVFGGNYSKILAKLKADDANGVASVTLRLGTQTHNATIEGASPAAQNANKNDSAPYSWDFGEITIPNTLTGPTTMRLIITDQAGTTREDNINFEIDNTKPVLSFTSHIDGATVFATADVIVRGSVDSNDLKEWKYVLTNTNVQPTVGDPKYKPLINGSTSFTLVFDGGSSTTSETHAEKLFKQICTLEGISETQLQADDTIRDLYLHIYGEDIAGNISGIKTLHLKAIPNGDKPTVSFSYPATNGASLGGTIRITGTSEIQQSEVEAVYIQIDPNPSLTWEKSENGTYYLNGSNYVKYTGRRYKHVSGNYIEDLNGEYVLINSTYSRAADTIYRVATATFTTGWSAHLTAVAGSHYPRVTVNYTGGNEQAIKTGGSVSSWNIALNSYNELNASKAVAIRIFAVSKTHKKSDYQTIWFRMDPDAPQIGSTKPLELVQYAGGASGGTIVARRSYESDMWIKGKWYLKGSVTDDSGIKSIRLKVGNTAPVDVVQITDAPNNKGDVNPAYSSYVTKGISHGTAPYENYDYELNIPVGSDTPNTFGILTYEISATEGASQSLGTKQTVKLNFDNKAPDFAGTTSEVVNKTSWAGKLTTELTGNEVVQNNNGNYGFYGIVNEASDATGNQSGFNRVAMYFTRTRPDGKTYVIDPMRKGGTSGLENFIETTPANFENYSSVSSGGDGLYWLKARQFTVSGNNILTATNTGTALHESIRRGGLVKVNGALYVIDTVDRTNKRITIKGSLSNGNADAYFAVCQVVDNFTQETGTTKAFNWTNPLSPSANDDGDQMIESVIENGTMATCKAFLDSKLILDGDVKIHFVAFDKAGNATEKEYNAKVRNNVPRLYGVKYGTDVNGNGTIEDDEYIKTFKDRYSVTIGSTEYYGYDGNLDTPVYSITAAERLTVKTSLKVVPRVIGGNLGLGYTYTYKSDPALPATTTTSISMYSGAGHHDPESLALRPDNLAIEITQKDFIQKIQDGDQEITFDLWDKTDGTNPGTDGNKAQIKIPVKVAVQDAEAPKATLKPFKWISASDNSLYANSKKNGHIELEADLPTPTFTTGGSGVFDRDPKISGIVTFEGSVKDNVVVKEIKIKIPNYNSGNAFTIATRNAAGVLISTNMLTLGGSPAKTYADYSFASTDWYFEVLTDKFEADGSNSVEFKFHFDTQKITGVAKADIKIELTAKDRGKASVSGTNINYTPNDSTPGTTQTTADTNTGYYKVDVVPYITGVKTSLSKTYAAEPSAFSRSATGAYSVRQGEKIQIEGFNLGENIASVTVEGMSATTLSNGTVGGKNVSNTITLSSAKSGNISLIVNGVEALNNKNAEPTFELKDDKYYVKTIEYNAEGNNLNNNKLTDDRKLFVWKFTDVVSDSGVRYPTMRVGKDSNQTVCFAYDSGAQAYKMYLSHNLSTSADFTSDYSFTQWYDTGVAVDKNGRIYGASQNGDSGGTGDQTYGGNYANGFFYAWNTKSETGTNSSGSTSAYNQGSKKRAIESTHNGTYFNGQRIRNPKLVTGDNGDAYLVYYDSSNDQIRFRYGKVSGSSSYPSFTGALDNHNGSNYGSAAKYQVIAGGTSPSSPTAPTGNSTSLGGTNATRSGEYSAVGLSTKTGAGYVSGTAVVAWYDASNQRLLFSYNTQPKSTSSANQWGQNTISIDSDFAGWYVDMIVDGNGGIHIAYYGASAGDLKYAYLEDYKDTNPKIVTVDSYLSVGSNISIDVLENTVGAEKKYIPYISYFMSAFTKTNSSVRVAWLNTTDYSKVDGVKKDQFTGDWEIMTIPTSQVPLDYTIGIGIKKNSSNNNSALLGYGTKKGLQTASLE